MPQSHKIERKSILQRGGRWGQVEWLDEWKSWKIYPERGDPESVKDSAGCTESPAVRVSQDI